MKKFQHGDDVFLMVLSLILLAGLLTATVMAAR